MRLLCNFHHSGYFLDIVLYIYDCKHNQTLNKLKDLFRVYLGRPKFVFSLIYMCRCLFEWRMGKRGLGELTYMCTNGTLIKLCQKL